MSLEENKALVRRYVDEVFNEGNTAAIPNYMRAGTLLAGNIEGTVKMFRRAFPDLHYTINDMVAEGDTVAIYVDWLGTNTGPSPRGEPPTGKQVASTAFWFFKIRDGKILTQVGTTDRMAIMEQLGLVQLPSQPTG